MYIFIKMSLSINETGFDVESVLPKGPQAANDAEINEVSGVVDEQGAKKTKYARTKANQPEALFRENNIDPELEAQLETIMDSIALPEVGAGDAAKAAGPATGFAGAAVDSANEIGIMNDLLVGSARGEITAKKGKKASGTSTKAPKKPRAKAKKSTASTAIDMETALNLDEDAMVGASEEEELKAKYILTIQRYQQSPIFGPYLKQMGVKHTAEAMQKKRNDQLEGIIKQIKTFINNKGAGEGLDYVLFTATGVSEQLVTGVSRGKYNLIGWTADLQGNGMFLEAWEQVKIERLSFAQASPEARMLIGMGMSAANVIARNKQQSVIAFQQMQQQIAANVPADLLSVSSAANGVSGAEKPAQLPAEPPAGPPAEASAANKFTLNQSIDRLF